MNHEKVAVLDFGSQYTHLLANRMRRHGVYTEILEPEVSADDLKEYKAIILSGGPQSVYAEDAPTLDQNVFDLGVPILGVCYGHQLMQHLLGGKVEAGGTKEYGLANINVKKPEGFFKNISEKNQVWMSHGDTVEELGPGFEEIASSEDLPFSAVANEERRFYGVQYHPEVTHSTEGMQMLDNFLDIAGVSRDWSIKEFIKEEIDAIHDKVGDKKVFLLCSGGVDSTVAFALLEKALGEDRVYGLLVDTGLMRLDEANKVKNMLDAAGFKNLHVADKKTEFLTALAGKTEPEEKRKIIGNLFWEVKEQAAEELDLNMDEWVVGQGTIYPDTIETGGTKHADTIKTHHNRVDLMVELIEAGKVIEPLAQLYKDEVRDLGEELGLPHELVWRQPFPGPGLGVRILCHSGKDVQREFAAEVTGLDAKDIAVVGEPNFEESSQNITKFINEQGIEGVAQVLPIKSVGVQGDERTYKHPVAIFTDSRNWDKLELISTGITNRFFEVNRVILALSGRPGEFSLSVADLSEPRVELLQRIDDDVNTIMAEAPESYDIWQFPVVLMPVSTNTGGESVVLRPIVSTEAMTASFARIDLEVLDKIVEKATGEGAVSHIFYDLTHKPPGTIEWE